MLEYFGNKQFMGYEATGFPQFALSNAYNYEEAEFTKTVECVSLTDVPENANVISSHVLYKININDDKSLKLKARIAPHGNEDCMKDDLKSACSMCSSVGLRILLLTASLQKWRLSKIDVKSASLQTGNAARDVYVIPPKESADLGKVLWLLLAAS